MISPGFRRKTSAGQHAYTGARETLRVFVGEERAIALHDSERCQVLRRNELQTSVLWIAHRDQLTSRYRWRPYVRL